MILYLTCAFFKIFNGCFASSFALVPVGNLRRLDSVFKILVSKNSLFPCEVKTLHQSDFIFFGTLQFKMILEKLYHSLVLVASQSSCHWAREKTVESYCKVRLRNFFSDPKERSIFIFFRVPIIRVCFFLVDGNWFFWNLTELHPDCTDYISALDI